MCSFVVVPLLETDVAELANLYVEAFNDNAAYRYVFPSNDEGLRWLFEKRVGMLLDVGSLYLVAKDASTGSIVGGVGCLRRFQKPTMWTMIWHGILKWPFL
jgi:hypothetical protein